jgi:hypothetical protein
VQSITMCHDALALHIVKHFANLLGRKFVVIQKRNELRDRPLEIDIVFPERIVGVNEKVLGMQGFSFGS